MEITVLTPLFPPDTGAPAPYAKELARHLSNHTVEVIAYGRLPESVPGVVIHPIDKRGFKLLLIWKCLRALHRHTFDILLVNNGPSAEVPALLFSFFRKAPIILIESDSRAKAQSTKGLYRYIHSAFTKRCQAVIPLPSEDTYLPPEILPFTTISPTRYTEIENWWKHHIQTLTSYGRT